MREIVSGKPAWQEASLEVHLGKEDPQIQGSTQAELPRVAHRVRKGRVWLRAERSKGPPSLLSPFPHKPGLAQSTP